MMLRRIRGRIIHKPLDRVSPLSVSVMLEIGRERVYGEGADEILAEAEAAAPRRGPGVTALLKTKTRQTGRDRASRAAAPCST